MTAATITRSAYPALLLQVKLTPPLVRGPLVARPHLFDTLNRGLDRALTLIAAPAGSGKSTLAAAWVRHGLPPTDTPPAIWLSLDDGDNDPLRFLHHLTAALHQVHSAVGGELETLLATPQAAGSRNLADVAGVLLLNGLARHDLRLIVVLDDYHLITNETIHALLQVLLAYHSPHLHLVLISRTQPPLPLARLRVRKQLTEIGSRDLFFTPTESATFYREVMALELPETALAHLNERTEGWPAALHLAALSLQQQVDPEEFIKRFRGSDRHVVDYLIEEVLQQLPPPLYEFLLQTALLTRLHGDLCRAVTEQAAAPALLAELEARNLFLIPLDNERQWYRYHPLFAEALQARLTASHREIVPTLHGRAYRWLAAHDEVEVAIDHALAAQQDEEAADLILQCCRPIVWQQGRPRRLLRWCAQLPETTFFARPPLVIAMGWAYLLMGQMKRLRALTHKMRTVWTPTAFGFAQGAEIRNELVLLEAESAVHQGDTAQVMRILDEIDRASAMLSPNTQAMVQQFYGYAHRLEGNLHAAKSCLQDALRLIDEGEDKSLWLFAHFDLAETHVIAGDYGAALALYDKILQRYPAEQYPHFLSLAYIYPCLARLFYYQNRLAEATAYLHRSLAISARVQWLTRYAWLMLAEIHFVQGKWSAVETLITQIRQSAGQRESRSTHLFFTTAIARLQLLHGEPAAAAAWATAYQAESATAAHPIHRYQHHQSAVTLARYHLATAPTTAVVQLYALQETAQQEQWRASLLEINILLALAHQAVAQPAQALAALDKALALAEPDQILTPFLVEGAPLATLLRLALPHATRRAFIGQLQAAFLPVTPAAPAVVPSQPLVEPLTSRELEILQMLATGLSNPEIAERLIIATGTVAKHTNNIFGKLAVRNRTEATQRAHALGLI